jgi:peptidoglycan/LPS O-acetylase OafA/YrhL
MGLGLSLYLDILRFGMALEVAIGHALGFIGHNPRIWFLAAYMQTAVTGFFVLSGFVIAYVSERSERDGRTYTAARIARLYSVVLPALALTFVFDSVGEQIDSPFYMDKAIGAAGEGDALGHYAASLFLMSTTWGVGWLVPGSNLPFWTMSYEAAYYALFGIAVFSRGPWRVVGVVAIAAIAGPQILGLFPIWLMGVAVYHLARRWTVPVWVAGALFAVSILLLVREGWLRNDIPASSVMLRYAEGTLVAINIYAAASLDRILAPLLRHGAQFVRWLGKLTFPLYLCHKPILTLLTVAPIAARGSLAQDTWLIGGVLCVTWIVTIFSEGLRVRIRSALLPACSRGDASSRVS